MKIQTRVIVSAAALALAAASFVTAESERRLTSEESIAAAVSKAQPEFPAMAKQLKLEGEVVLLAHVSEDGKVEKVETVSGNPILSRSAQDALMRWKFQKQTEDGKPVRYAATISFKFKQ